MREDPNKAVEKMLRDYSEERRKSEPLPMHPATRRMLHGEVRRVYGQSASAPGWKEKLLGHFPEIAIATAVCMVASLIFLRVRPKQTDVVMNQHAREEVLRSAPPAAIPEPNVSQASNLEPPSTPAAEPKAMALGGSRAPSAQERALSDLNDTPKKSVGEPQSPQSMERKLALTPPPVAHEKRASAGYEAMLAESGAESKLALRGEATSADPGAPTSPVLQNTNGALARRIPATRLPKGSELTNLGAAMRMTFFQVTNQSASAQNATPQPWPILSTFQVERAGTQVRFLDADGSVYSGSLAVNPGEIAALGGFGGGVGAQQKQISVSGTQGAERPLAEDTRRSYFKVIGTNQTMGMPVIVSGQLLERTNIYVSPESTFSFRAEEVAEQQQQAASEARRTIIGTALLGQTNEFPIQAISRE